MVLLLRLCKKPGNYDAKTALLCDYWRDNDCQSKMSKRKSIPQGNTLFNYFQSPKNKPKLQSTSSTSSGDGEKIKEDLIPSDPDEDIVPSSQKRKRIKVIVDSDSETENSEPAVNTPPQKSKKLKTEPSTSKNRDTPTKALKAFSFEKVERNSEIPKSKTVNDSQKSTSTAAVAKQLWTHEKLKFLEPEHIKDANKRRPDHPDYDPKTLYVPEDYLNSLTPAMRQWWVLKSKHMDCVMFFKVGKFYELYHMDAVVGVNHLGFTYMKGEFAHSGFPEIAYGRMASSLIEQGFKVMRIEQTETPEMMAERLKASKHNTKFDKVVKREICQITTKGTCVYGAQIRDAKDPLPCYMMAIAEKKIKEGVSRYGVCFIDTSIGIFHLSEFDDDKHCSKLLVLLSQNAPGLILTENNHCSLGTNEILKRRFGDVRRENLKSGTQFLSGAGTVKKLHEECYFKDSNNDVVWPNVLKDLISDGAPKPDYELAFKALGACWHHLKDSELDIQVFSMGKFQIYHPLTSSAASQNMEFMILDSVTIENLKLLGGRGTLQNTLDTCSTAFGKRLLLQWICRPLCDVEKLTQRQNAVTELLNNTDLLQSSTNILKKLPDLERQIAKIHAFGNKFCSLYHPDSRAIFYESKAYSKRKIFDLLSTLRGFEKAQEIPDIFKGCDSRLLRKITQYPSDGIFINLTEPLSFFKEAFDQDQAEKEGQILPQKGVEDDYDAIEGEISSLNEELTEYLNQQKKFFGCNVAYFGSDKKRFQLEIPENKCHKVTDEYMLEGTKKGKGPAKRYSTPDTKNFLARMLKAEAERAKIIQDLNRRVFEKFSNRYEEWDQVTHCLSILDVLCALANFAKTYSEEISCPKLLPFTENPVIKIENGRHPCIQNLDTFVPNDTNLGTEDHARILILTGPNMGGKSTLMRQVALINVMAQIGSYVPASYCELSVTDRIFTRLGANDDIIKGQSTFLVEVCEASAILQHATRNSLVLLDELGRGTSTHDGNAIATSYLQKLTEINCRVVYSTHYHNLVEHFDRRSDIQLGHMDCLVENEGDIAKETVTFLYKMKQGVCPKSYGFNVAKLAGLPQEIISRAHELAQQLEAITKNRELFTSLFATKDPARIKELLAC